MINIGIVEPDTLLLSSLKKDLTLAPEFNIAFQFLSGNALLNSLRHIRPFPDIVIINVNLPDISFIKTMIMINKSYPRTKIICLSDLVNNRKIKETIENGANGFVSKGTDKLVLIDGIRQVLLDKIFICIEKNKTEIDRRDYPKEILLTEKQKIFLKHCASDLPYKQIAEILHVSVKTADRYRDELFHKLNVKSKVGLALFAVRTGLAENR